MSEMIDKMAKAMFEHTEKKNEARFGCCVPWESVSVSSSDRDRWRALAEVAIGALRDPTPRMLQFAAPHMDSSSSNMAWWDAMLTGAAK